MIRTIGLLLLLAVCQGCDAPVRSDLPRSSDLPAGEYEVQVRGDVVRSFRGEAVFETLYGPGGQPLYWLRLRDLEDGGKRRYRIVDFTGDQEGPPGRGVYALSASGHGDGGKSGDFTAHYQELDVDDYRFRSLGGTLEIYASDATHVEGSFTFAAYDVVTAGPGVVERVEVVVSGKFHAVKGAVGIVLN